MRGGGGGGRGGRGGRGGGAAGPPQKGSMRDLTEMLVRADPGGMDMKQVYGAMAEERPRPLFPPAAFRRFPWGRDALAREEQFMVDEYRALVDDIAASPLNLDLVSALRAADNTAKSGAPLEELYAARQHETTERTRGHIGDIEYSTLFTREVFAAPPRARKRGAAGAGAGGGGKRGRLHDRRAALALGRLDAHAEGGEDDDDEDDEDEAKKHPEEEELEGDEEDDEDNDYIAEVNADGDGDDGGDDDEGGREASY